jgi:hypothetical protein
MQEAQTAEGREEKETGLNGSVSSDSLFTILTRQAEIKQQLSHRLLYLESQTVNIHTVQSYKNKISVWCQFNVKNDRKE